MDERKSEKDESECLFLRVYDLKTEKLKKQKKNRKKTHPRNSIISWVFFVA